MAEKMSSAITTVPGDGEPPFRYGARLANEIELAWQERWEAEGTFHSPNPVGDLAEGFEAVKGRPKFYALDMFPYPSGTGLHVGHPLGYIGTDVFARYLRMTGHHVLHTFGYDAFGLPAEQYAISTGQHPGVTTKANIDNMRRQLRRLGLAHDTRREVATTDVTYYRWTQWIFLRIFNSWYDEAQGRARGIEELIAEFDAGRRRPGDGRNWAELTPAQRRDVIDGYRLAYISCELVNWCPGLGTVLANEEVTADGRSDVGNFPVFRRPLRQWMLRITAFAQRLIDDLDLVDWPTSIKLMQRNWIGASDGADIDLAVIGHPDSPIRVFTTRPDTLAAATYVVLAAEHPLLDHLAAAAWPDQTPENWRYADGRAGAAGWSPRDAIARYRKAAAAGSRQRTQGYGKSGVFTGAYAQNPATGEPMPVFCADYVLMGYGSGAIMGVPAHDQRDLDFARTFGLPVQATGRPAPGWPGEDGIDAAVTWLAASGHGRRARSYRLRDWLFSRQRYWGEPIPIVYDEDDRPVALPDELLPVLLPRMTDFRPRSDADDEHSDPVPPLARARDWADVELDLGEGTRRYRRELNTMPQWAGSCWYYLRYLDPANDQAFVDPQVERYWMAGDDAPAGAGGVDLYVGGVEHAVLHLLYARFWHKVLYDLGYVSTREPFRRLYNQGYVLADAFTDERGMYVPAGEVVQAADGSCTFGGAPVTRRAGKMGKSLKNSISPDEMYAAYGADTLRLYEMATGPLNVDRPWRTGDVVGVYRFLQRLWRCVVDEETGQPRVSEVSLTADSAHRLHRTIKVVRRDFEGLRFNTAVTRLMELTAHAAKVSAEQGAIPRALAEPLILMVAPLAPHVAEELWSRLGHDASLACEAFPVADDELASEPVVTLPVQVNGKSRFTIDVPSDATQDAIEQQLASHPAFAALTEGLTVRRLVIVPGRIVNIVAQ